MGWTKKEKDMLEEVDESKCHVENKLPRRLQGFISLSEMISLTDNAIHHSLWSTGKGEAMKGT